MGHDKVEIAATTETVNAADLKPLPDYPEGTIFGVNKLHARRMVDRIINPHKGKTPAVTVAEFNSAI